MIEQEPRRIHNRGGRKELNKDPDVDSTKGAAKKVMARRTSEKNYTSQGHKGEASFWTDGARLQGGKVSAREAQ